VRADLRPRCWVASALDPIDGRYDLVTCIEVLEHLENGDVDRAVANICAVTDDVLFSSTPSDYREETHVNVRPPEYWAELFARHGFVRDVGFDASFVAWWAARYRRARDPWPRLAAEYEREQWRLRQEARERNVVVLTQLERIGELERRVDELSRASKDDEVGRLSQQLSDSHAVLVESSKELQEYHKLRARVGVRLMVRMEGGARRLAPKGTRRRTVVRGVARGLEKVAEDPVGAARIIGRKLTGRSSHGMSGLDSQYQQWLAATAPTPERLAVMRESSRSWSVRPLISIVFPVYNTDERWLKAAIGSVRAQAYENWELCVADDASTDPHVREILEAEAAAEPRVKVTYRSVNGGIAEASNSALELARGDYVAFLDHDDVLRPHALFQVVARIHLKPRVDIIYSDEDLILLDGRRGSAFFKPNWSPAWLLAQNYITHLMVVRRRLLTRVGGFRTGYDGSQDHDLLLRLTEKTDRVEHVADVLYSWRQTPGSTALSGDEKPLARLAGRQSVEDALGRRGTPGRVELGPTPGIYDYRYELAETPAVTVLIPTRDRVDLLRRCLDSIAARTTYPNLEIVILDNDSRNEATLAYLAACGHRIVAAPGPFNYSRIVNIGARATTAPYILLLNNDTTVMTDDWVERLLEFCQQPDIGVVGCQLRYGDGRVQHTGIGIGYGHMAYNLGMEWGVPRDATAVTGACMMVKREAFERVDGFDETMGIAYGDVDFCLRVRKIGLRVVYTPFAWLEHEESSSRGRLDPAADHSAFRGRWGAEDTLQDPFLTPHICWPDPGRLRIPGG
jgi:GT2 family glycosyltransferase